jgi:hypothetical protein
MSYALPELIQLSSSISTHRNLPLLVHVYLFQCIDCIKEEDGGIHKDFICPGNHELTPSSGIPRMNCLDCTADFREKCLSSLESTQMVGKTKKPKAESILYQAGRISVRVSASESYEVSREFPTCGIVCIGAKCPFLGTSTSNLKSHFLNPSHCGEFSEKHAVGLSFLHVIVAYTIRICMCHLIIVFLSLQYLSTMIRAHDHCLAPPLEPHLLYRKSAVI